MPRKIRELEKQLKKAGFQWSPGKGNHRWWTHPSGVKVLMSGNAGHDAKHYQERETSEAITEAQQKSKQ